MLFYLVAWTFLFLVCLVIGTAVLRLTAADGYERESDRAILAVWLGLVLLAIALLGISLVLPLSPLVGLGTALLGVGCSLYFRPVRQELFRYSRLYSQPRLSLVGILVIGIAAFSTREVAWFDTGLYHYGVIKWLAEFGTVPGLGLINSRFGFTSAWFALLAPFASGLLTARASAVANSFIFYLAIGQWLMSAKASLTADARLADRFITLFLGMTLPIAFVIKIPWFMIVSTAPDFPLILLTGIIAWAILLSTSERPLATTLSGSQRLLDVRIIPLILATGAMAIKLNGIALVPIAILFYLMGGQLTWKRIAVGLGLPFLLLLPIFLYGYVVIGFPLFPATWFGLDFPWTIQVAIAQELEALPNPWVPTGEKLSWFDQIWRWLFNLITQWLPGEKLNILIPLLLGVSVIAGLQILKKFRQQHFEGRPWLLLLGATGSLLVMLKSPLLRHGLGYFAVLPAYWVADQWPSLFRRGGETLGKIFNSVSQTLPQFLSLIWLSVLASILMIWGATKHLDYLLLPSRLPTVTLHQAQVNDVIYFYPTVSTQCWAEELPCAIGPIEDDIQLREPTQGIGGGFIYRK